MNYESKAELTEDDYEEKAARLAAFFRENIDIFAAEYLGFDNLKLFQKINLVMMDRSAVFMWIAARGMGKSYLAALFAVCRCILYPGTKVCVCSGTRGQSSVITEKIGTELVPASPRLREEIDMDISRFKGEDARIEFLNGSYIKVVTASDNARGTRANLLITDEFRMVKKETAQDVLKKFLTSRRMPPYSELTPAERTAEYEKEPNRSCWLSSAYFKDHWSYQFMLDTVNLMAEGFRSAVSRARGEDGGAASGEDGAESVQPGEWAGQKTPELPAIIPAFCCSTPYELSVAEGLLFPEDISAELEAEDFNEVRWRMEMEALWFGADGSSFFDFDDISKNRVIDYPMLPERLLRLPGLGALASVPPKAPGEIRILSADIALMAGKNNDATAIFINQVKGEEGRIVYAEVSEGMRTDDQALVIRRLFEEFSCDWIVLDTLGLGLGVYDALAGAIFDRETGEVYPPLSCANSREMAARCRERGARKAIWSVKATAAFNSDCALLLRDGFRRGRLKLLKTEYDGEEFLSRLSGWGSLSHSDKTALLLPYIHTTLLINELTRLEYSQRDGLLRISEKSGMRKDRYSSLSYSYYVQNVLSGRKKKGDSSFPGFAARAPVKTRGRRI